MLINAIRFSKQMRIVAIIVRFCFAPTTLVYISTVFLLILPSARDQLAEQQPLRKLTTRLKSIIINKRNKGKQKTIFFRILAGDTIHQPPRTMK